MAADESVKSVRVNRLALILLTVIATVIGVTPVALLLDRPHLLLYYAVGAVFVAGAFSFTLKVSESSCTEPPSFLEFVLGGVGAIYMPAIMGIVWLIFYGLIYGVTSLVGLIAAWVGWQVQPNADLIAFYPSLILAALFELGAIVGNLRNLKNQLYPDTAGVKSAFYNLLMQGQKRLMGCAAGALFVLGAILVALVALGGANTWLCILLQLYLAAVCMPLWAMNTEVFRHREAVSTVGKIGELFKRAGYEVERFPRTHKADIDPWLVNLDLYVQKDEHQVFVEVKTAQEVKVSSEARAAGEETKPSDGKTLLRILERGWAGEEIKPSDRETLLRRLGRKGVVHPAGEEIKLVDWKAASGLTTAASVLGEQRELPPEAVGTLLVLVDVQADKSLAAFEKQENSRVLPLTSEEIERVFEKEGSDEERRDAARQLLGVPPVAPSPSDGGRDDR